MKINVWFNHWFSTVYYIVKLLKEDDKINFYVYGTSDSKFSLIRGACDEFYTEPEAEGEEYIKYCLDFCVNKKIDVFVPRKNMLLISRNIEKFDAIGVKVLMERDNEKMEVLNDKYRTYDIFKSLEIAPVPENYIVNSAEGFEVAYEKIKTENNRVCVKYASDEGGKSFRVIDDSIAGSNGFIKAVGMKMSYKNVLEALREMGQFKNLMVMPYLNGKEVSVDCLKTQSGVIYIPREKTESRAERVYENSEITDYCRNFYEKYNIEQPCNIQFKYHDGLPYVLEVNTRMSGGIQLSCLATGVNIPNIAVNGLLGINKKWQLKLKNTYVAYVEKPVILGEDL